MNHKTLVFACLALFALSGSALGSDREEIQKRCHEFAVEKNIEPENLESYMDECIALQQELNGESDSYSSDEENNQEDPGY